MPTSWRSMVGIGGRKGRTEMGVEARQMFQCLEFPTCQIELSSCKLDLSISWPSSKKPGSGRA